MASNTNNPDFYVYRYLRADTGEVFYIVGDGMSMFFGGNITIA